MLTELERCSSNKQPIPWNSDRFIVEYGGEVFGVGLERGNLDEVDSSVSLGESNEPLLCFLLFDVWNGDESELTVNNSESPVKEQSESSS